MYGLFSYAANNLGSVAWLVNNKLQGTQKEAIVSQFGEMLIRQYPRQVELNNKYFSVEEAVRIRRRNHPFTKQDWLPL